MNAFIRRYELDDSAPTRADFWRDLLRRALLPAVGVFVLLVAAGFTITGPLDGLPAELSVNEALAKRRTPALDTLTHLVSVVGNTEFVIGLSVLVIGLLWWRTRQWWWAAVPGIAVALQAVVFMASATVVGRERPDVEALDHAPPTSSFPSGHTGAAAAVYLALALLAQRVVNPVLRWGITILCILMPLVMGFSRLYRGMHSLTDVLFGLLNGVVCALIAWAHLRREVAEEAAGDNPEPQTRA